MSCIHTFFFFSFKNLIHKQLRERCFETFENQFHWTKNQIIICHQKHCKLWWVIFFSSSLWSPSSFLWILLLAGWLSSHLVPFCLLSQSSSHCFILSSWPSYYFMFLLRWITRIFLWCTYFIILMNCPLYYHYYLFVMPPCASPLFTMFAL